MNSFWNKFFKDKHDKVVIWQNPNPALWTWFISMIIGRVGQHGWLNSLAELVAFGALFAWAWMELFQGVNYFRRSVGAVLLVAIILSHLK